MLRLLVRIFAVSALASAWMPALAQGLQPGQWEFTNTMQMSGAPKPQVMTTQRCVTKQESEDPEKWMGKKADQADCKVTVKNKTATSASWEISCPKSGMRGTGTARISSGTMESDQRMTGDMQGKKFEMQIRTTGKRLGPCKS